MLRRPGPAIGHHRSDDSGRHEHRGEGDRPPRQVTEQGRHDPDERGADQPKDQQHPHKVRVKWLEAQPRRGRPPQEQGILVVADADPRAMTRTAMVDEDLPYQVPLVMLTDDLRNQDRQALEQLSTEARDEQINARTTLHDYVADVLAQAEARGETWLTHAEWTSWQNLRDLTELLLGDAAES